MPDPGATVLGDDGELGAGIEDGALVEEEAVPLMHPPCA